MAVSYNGLWKLLIDKNMKKIDLVNKLSGGELKFQPTAILPQINFVTLYLYLLQRAVYYRTLFSFLFLTFLSRFCIFIS